MNEIVDIIKQLLDWGSTKINDLSGSIGVYFPHLEVTAEIYTLTARWIFPILAVYIFLRCILPLLRGRKNGTVWGYLYMGSTRIPIKHWENSIGRSKLSDIIINLPYISRSHAVLTFRNGNWSIADLNSKNGVEVNGKKIEKPETVKHGDTISLAGCKTVLVLPQKETGRKPHKNYSVEFAPSGKHIKSGATFLLILLFQIMGSIQICISIGEELNPVVPLLFFLFILAECLHYITLRLRSRTYLELELLCYFLCGLSLFIVASASPDALFIQFLAIIAGMVIYTVLKIIISDLGRANKVKYILAASALILLVLNLAIGETRFGATRWINFGFLTFQPSEFVKIAFVMAGAATLDRLLTTRNMTAFIAFSGACLGALILMRDFGSVVVFFGAFVVIAFMRSGDVRTIAFISAGAVLGAVTVISFMPYIASRFETWGNVWEYAYTSGYQQARTLIAAASGGLLGVGGGNGYLADISAADTDLVFGMLSEEWGMIVALTVVLSILFFAFYAILSTKYCRSSFYAITACGAASMFLIQTALNVLGSVDILPFTGVTIPFISRGGSSMIASWGLLAFIKSADERRRPGKAGISNEKGD